MGQKPVAVLGVALSVEANGKNNARAFHQPFEKQIQCASVAAIFEGRGRIEKVSTDKLGIGSLKGAQDIGLRGFGKPLGKGQGRLRQITRQTERAEGQREQNTE